MITAIVLAKNEETNLEECLKDLKWCDEIIVVDDFSSDNTATIAKNEGVKVITRQLNDDFSTQRNFALASAKGDWILFIDADERVSSKLQYEIKAEILSSVFNGFILKREDIMFGKKLRYGEVGNLYVLRLAKKNLGQWSGEVHEVWDVKGKIGKLHSPLLHYPHQTIAEFLSEVNYYSTLRAKELYKKGKRANFLTVILYPKGKFLQNYFLKLGFLDGIPGLIVSLIMSFHSFLVRAKLWLLWQKKN